VLEVDGAELVPCVVLEGGEARHAGRGHDDEGRSPVGVAAEDSGIDAVSRQYQRHLGRLRPVRADREHQRSVAGHVTLVMWWTAGVGDLSEEAQPRRAVHRQGHTVVTQLFAEAVQPPLEG